VDGAPIPALHFAREDIVNRRNRLSTTAVGLALAGLLTAGPAGAGMPPRGHDHDGHGGPMMHLLSQLDLSDAQKTQVQGILEDEHPKLAPLMEAGMKAHHALEQAIHAPIFDENAIRAAATQAGIAEADLAVEKGRMVSRIRAVLTPEQQKQMETLHEQARQHHGSWDEATEDAPDAR
jgi:Spy/CpxP family protein refolding chaperone